MASPAILTRLLDEHRSAERDVVVYAGHDEWTLAELRSTAADLAVALRGLGVVAGHLVGVMLPSGTSSVAALFGVWEAGAVYVPINPRSSDDELARVLADLRPSVIVTDQALAPRVPQDRGLIVAEESRWDVRRPATGATGTQDPGVALVQFTSGTTGPPKAVLLRHDGILQLIDGVLSKLGANTKATGAAGSTPMPNLIPVSMSLWAGIYNVLFAFRVGAPVVIMERFEPPVFADLVRRFEIRSTVLPPAAMAMLTDSPDITSLAPLRFVRSITAPLSPVQARRFHERFGINILNSYGQTEIGGEIVGWNADDSRTYGESKLGSVGRPHEGVTIRVIDEAGNDTDGDGELWVRTPAMAAGYADGGDLSDRLSPDGWFRTGDLGSVDDDGFVWIEGRASDLINRGGLKVFPAEVEDVVRRSPLIADVAVSGIPDDRLGEVPWAFVVLTGTRTTAIDPTPRDNTELVRSLTDECRQHLVPYKVPAGFTVLDEIPRNEVGKVLRDHLAQLIHRDESNRTP